MHGSYPSLLVFGLISCVKVFYNGQVVAHYGTADQAVCVDATVSRFDCVLRARCNMV